MRIIPFDQSFESYCQMVENRLLDDLKKLNSIENKETFLNQEFRKYLFESIIIFEKEIQVSKPQEIGFIDKSLNNFLSKNNKIKFIITIPFKGTAHLFSIRLTNSKLLDFEITEKNEILFKYYSSNDCEGEWISKYEHDLERLKENIVLWNNLVNKFNKKIIEIIQINVDDNPTKEYLNHLDGMRFKHYYPD